MDWLNRHAVCQLMAEFQPASNRLASWVGPAPWRWFIAAGELAAGAQQALPDITWRTDPFLLALRDHPAEIAAFQRRLADWILGLIRDAVSAKTGPGRGPGKGKRR